MKNILYAQYANNYNYCIYFGSVSLLLLHSNKKKKQILFANHFGIYNNYLGAEIIKLIP